MFEKKILETIAGKMKRKGYTVAVAESVTAGLLQFAFAQMSDARLFFQGGMTTYNLGQKFKHLDVEPIGAEACNCVSQDVADQMALQVAKKFRSDWGISITGYATPAPESGNRLFCFYAISYKGKIKLRRKLLHTKATPAIVQQDYVNAILKKFSSLT